MSCLRRSLQSTQPVLFFLNAISITGPFLFRRCRIKQTLIMANNFLAALNEELQRHSTRPELLILLTT